MEEVLIVYQCSECINKGTDTFPKECTLTSMFRYRGDVPSDSILRTQENGDKMKCNFGFQNTEPVWKTKSITRL